MLEQSLFISLCVVACWGLFLPGEIFGRAGDWMDENLPKKILPAVAQCPYCMTFWWGSLIHILRYGITETMPWTILCAMGFSLVFVKFYERKEEK